MGYRSFSKKKNGFSNPLIYTLLLAYLTTDYRSTVKFHYQEVEPDLIPNDSDFTKIEGSQTV